MNRLVEQDYVQPCRGQLVCPWPICPSDICSPVSQDCSCRLDMLARFTSRPRVWDVRTTTSQPSDPSQRVRHAALRASQWAYNIFNSNTYEVLSQGLYCIDVPGPRWSHDGASFCSQSAADLRARAVQWQRADQQRWALPSGSLKGVWTCESCPPNSCPRADLQNKRC